MDKDVALKNIDNISILSTIKNIKKTNINVVTGCVGSGKTNALRFYVETLKAADEDQKTPYFISIKDDTEYKSCLMISVDEVLPFRYYIYEDEFNIEDILHDIDEQIDNNKIDKNKIFIDDIHLASNETIKSIIEYCEMTNKTLVASVLNLDGSGTPHPCLGYLMGRAYGFAHVAASLCSCGQVAKYNIMAVGEEYSQLLASCYDCFSKKHISMHFLDIYYERNNQEKRHDSQFELERCLRLIDIARYRKLDDKYTNVELEREIQNRLDNKLYSVDVINLSKIGN